MTTLFEDPGKPQELGAWTGDWHGYVVQLTDANGSPVDITSGTLSATFTDVATGSAYSFGAGAVTLTKGLAAQGIVTILNPAAYPTPATVRLTIAWTVSTTVRRFGPLEITVSAP